MPAPLGIGVVGAGIIGIRGALAHLSLEDVQDRVFLTAVCDPVPGRAAAAARRFDVARAYERYEDLLEDPAVARHVIAIIEAGYQSAETGHAQDLETTFDLDLGNGTAWSA